MYAQYFLRIEMHQVGSCQLGSLKHQKAIVTYLEVLKHQESCGCCFWRLSHIENVSRDEYTGHCKTIRKVELLYLDVNL